MFKIRKNFTLISTVSLKVATHRTYARVSAIFPFYWSISGRSMIGEYSTPVSIPFGYLQWSQTILLQVDSHFKEQIEVAGSLESREGGEFFSKGTRWSNQSLFFYNSFVLHIFPVSSKTLAVKHLLTIWPGSKIPYTRCLDYRKKSSTSTWGCCELGLYFQSWGGWTALWRLLRRFKIIDPKSWITKIESSWTVSYQSVNTWIWRSLC